MKKNLLNIFCLNLLFSSQIISQQFSPGSPEWIVDMFFRAENFPAKANYFTGEMLNEIDHKTIGEELQGKGETSFKQIKSAGNEIAFKIELQTADKVIDFYCYLKKTGGIWKLEAVRRFLLPPFIYLALDSLVKINSPSESDMNLIKTLELFTMDDSSLKNFIGTNLNSLNDLTWYFNQMENEKVNVQLKSLGCSAIFKDKNYPGCIFIQINSIERMEAGFIYTLAGARIPLVSHEEFIYIEEVLPHWFIYRIM